MKPLHIFLIICGGILFLLIAFIVMVRISNKRKFNRLQKNLKKLKQEKEDYDNDKRISIEESPAVKEEIKEKKTNSESPLIEDYQEEEISDTVEEIVEEKLPEAEEDITFYDESIVNKERENQIRNQRNKEFEEFMNEHSYSRKVLDKKLVNKIKELPPEIKAIILNNVFEKFDDNK